MWELPIKKLESAAVLLNLLVNFLVNYLEMILI